MSAIDQHPTPAPEAEAEDLSVLSPSIQGSKENEPQLAEGDNIETKLSNVL
jgi:hypothetical protein